MCHFLLLSVLKLLAEVLEFLVLLWIIFLGIHCSNCEKRKLGQHFSMGVVKYAQVYFDLRKFNNNPANCLISGLVLLKIT